MLSMARTVDDVKRLSTLVDVTHTLFSTRNLKAALHRLLEILERDHGMVRSVVTMLNDGSGQLKTTGGNCARAAKLLNTTERIFGYRIKKYAIACDRLRR